MEATLLISIYLRSSVVLNTCRGGESFGVKKHNLRVQFDKESYGTWYWNLFLELKFTLSPKVLCRVCKDVFRVGPTCWRNPSEDIAQKKWWVSRSTPLGHLWRVRDVTQSWELWPVQWRTVLTVQWRTSLRRLTRMTTEAQQRCSFWESTPAKRGGDPDLSLQTHWGAVTDHSERGWRTIRGWWTRQFQGCMMKTEITLGGWGTIFLKPVLRVMESSWRLEFLDHIWVIKMGIRAPMTCVNVL